VISRNYQSIRTNNESAPNVTISEDSNNRFFVLREYIAGGNFLWAWYEKQDQSCANRTEHEQSPWSGVPFFDPSLDPMPSYTAIQ
jgi:hypothetical protein